MRVAVTGASGFVGRHLVRALLAQGAQVVTVSRNPDSPVNTNVTPLALDIGAAGDNPLARMGHPDILIHLAWGGLPNYRSPTHSEQELPRHVAFLDRCLDAGLPRLVVAGTCLEYGMTSGELHESMPAEATTHYGQAKNTLHAHLLDRREREGFGLGWLRLFYLHGPGQATNSLFSQLHAAVAKGAQCFDMSQGDQVRDFLPVTLAAEHIASISLRHADPGTVNVCSGRPVTVVDAIEGWLRDAGATIRLNRGVLARPDYEPFAFWGCTRRLHSLLETP